MTFEYKPIRIVKDIQVQVATRALAERHYPHGEIKKILGGDRGEIPCFIALYEYPKRINAPTDAERALLVGSGFAKEIPQHKELKCDDPRSPLSGSRVKATRHRKQAMEETYVRNETEQREASTKKEKVIKTYGDEIETSERVKSEIPEVSHD